MNVAITYLRIWNKLRIWNTTLRMWLWRYYKSLQTNNEILLLLTTINNHSTKFNLYNCFSTIVLVSLSNNVTVNSTCYSLMLFGTNILNLINASPTLLILNYTSSWHLQHFMIHCAVFWLITFHPQFQVLLLDVSILNFLLG